MHTKDESVLTPLADVNARRALVSAGRVLIKYKLSFVAASYSLTTQNLYTWLTGKEGALSEERQHSAMAMYGFLPNGRLMHTALHAWIISNQECVESANVMLTYETDIRDVRISPVFTTVQGRRRDPSERVRHFIGASVSWSITGANDEQLPRRLIMTAFSGVWTQDAFMGWATNLFASQTAPGCSIEIGPDLDVVQAAAETIWYWHLKPRLANGSRANTTPNKGLLPFEQDIIGKAKAPTESALSVLQDMAPRFKRLAEQGAAQRNVLLSTSDLSIIRRAKAVIDADTE